MCKFESRWLYILAAALICASCSAKDGGQSAESLAIVPSSQSHSGDAALPDIGAASLTAALPLPASLRGSSSVNTVSGSAAINAAGCMNDGINMYLALGEATLSLPQPEEGEEPPLMSPPLQGIAFAVYLLNTAGELPSTLRISSGPHYDTKMWIGFADWERNAWDFEPGGFFSTPEIALANYGNGNSSFISPAGDIAVAVVVCDEIEPVMIKQLSLNIVSEVSGFVASANRWDGVQLSWDSHPQADFFRLWRRPLGSKGTGWTELSAKPLESSQGEFLDNDIEDNADYEYLIRAGDVRYAQSVPQTFWSKGAYTVGSLRDSTIEEEAAGVGALYPVNMQNYLSYICLSGVDGGNISALRCSSFPPTDGWESYSSADGVAGDLLTSSEGFEAPLHLFPYTETNNPVVTIGYSTADGSYAQVSTAEADGSVEFEEPVAVREGGHVLLDMLHLPRRIGMLTWNLQEERMEIVDSIDSVGRYWYEFDPMGYPWMLVTTRRPQGKVEVLDRSSGVTLFYREALTDELVIIRMANDVWVDESPGVKIGGCLKVHNVLEHPAGPARCVLYLSREGTALRMLLRNSQGVWQTDSIRDLVSIEEGQLSEFELFTRGSYSSRNYLAYIHDGNLSVIRCHDPYFDSWSTPHLLSLSGTCRNVRGLTVGTDEDFTESYDYLSFIEDGPQGQPQIRYIDLSTTYEEMDK